MTTKKIIDGLYFTVGMMLFNPATCESKTPDELNEDDRYTYDACMGAIELLKAQEPRMMTLEELDALGDNAIVWLECLYTVDGMKTTTLQPAIYQSDNSSPEEDGYYCVVSSWSHSGFYHKDNYGGDWRCWTSRPDEKRRFETPWNAQK